MARSRTSGDSGGFVPPDADQLLPVYLVHGEEDFLVEEAVQGLIAVAVEEEARGFNLDVLQGADADVRDILACASSFPMMAPRRAVVVRDLDKLGAKEVELLAPYLEHPAPTTVLILTAVKPDMRRKVYAAISRQGGAVPCKPLNEAQLVPWILRRVKGKKLGIEDDAARLLSTLVGRSLRELDMELDKLALFLGARTTITADDVATVVGVSRQYNIFELQRAIAAADVRKADEILQRMLEAGNGAPFFVVMLTSFFVTVWRVHDCRRRGLGDGQIASELKRESWMIQDHLSAARRFPPSRVEHALRSLLQLDERSKTGGDETALLHTFLVDLMADAVSSPTF